MFLYRFILIFLITCVSFSANAQHKNKKNKDEKEFKGIRYQLQTTKKERKKALAITDSSIVELRMAIFNSTDSLLRNTDDEDFPLILDLRDSTTRQIPIVEIMMKDGKIGDSLSLFIHSDSVFQNGQIRPIFIPKGSSLRHEIKIVKNYSEQEYADKLEAMQQKYMDEMKQKQQQEKQKAEMEAKSKVQNQIDYLENTYFVEKGITNFQKTESGLYYVIDEQGTPIEKGQTIKVHYEGTLLNGQKFDSSFDRNSPIEFPIGVGQVIQGWDEGIIIIGKGGKGTLYIPSHLGYGERGAGGIIKPNSTLVFRVEVLD
ncbi:FKBP-type peptidyl-prolyl cis-trans isomerase [Bernardetia litoralis DSM 6794]|uniref:Peptidyl-prolyl cis-trans isomerase n=1 Tax=Bernardetia litoralis (strain ATCC 23117 / DSM 6794 / NBRC 15988 / NCIMB 1366 / Fx l1 / Sio-4) TaxID=880071 RepID=I4AGW8_BERLS|nr:FKBP-type peptidyl-prolyl cis-trans isomerase [Bernardetia litoralis]AFM03203.1 FKBP-type peptidyl-prolyl cis-trans isomerase [Bernardetia litoralis DSM 6794]